MGLVLWLVFLIAFFSIMGIPWGRACILIGNFTFFPFGREPISRNKLTQEDDLGTGTLGLPCKFVWLLLAGIVLSPVGKTIVSK